MRRILMLFMVLLFATFSFAQEVTNNKKVTSVSGVYNSTLYTIDCDGWGFFSDSLGVDKPYRNNEDYYTTICSDEAAKGVSVSFQQFALEKTDFLYVYDEARTAPVNNPAPVLALIEDAIWRAKMATTLGAPNFPNPDHLVGKFTGRSSPGTITSKKGCLTFHFVSDATVVEKGWYAKITCGNKPVADPCKEFNKLVDSDLKCGVKIVDDNIRGKNTYSTWGACNIAGWPSPGRELIYRFVNHKASDLVFTLNEYNGTQPKVLSLFILNDCNPNACNSDVLSKIYRPAENRHQGRNTATILNAPAGTYYVVVDANKGYAHNAFDLTVECTGGDYTVCNNPYYYDDFEEHDASEKHGKEHGHQTDFHVGDNITRTSPYWFKSDNVGIRDARISADRSANGTQSLEFNRKDEGTQDVYLDLGRKFKGVYRICWNMFIENHHTAFFALFGGDNSDPWGTVSKEFEHGNSYTGRWFDVELFVDLDKNKYTLYLDNRCESYSGVYNLNLDKLNFYGLPKAHFYIDHLCYGAVSKIPRQILEKPIALTNNYKKEHAIAAPTFTDNTSSFTQLTTNTLTVDDLSIAPNPTRGLTTISLNLAQEQNVTLQIFSQTGQVVRSIALGRTQFIQEDVDLSDLPNGLYLLKATGEQSLIVKKIVLQQ